MRTSFNVVVLENASHKATISSMASRLEITERKVLQLCTPPPQLRNEKFTRSSLEMGSLSPHLHHASDVDVIQAAAVNLQDKFMPLACSPLGAVPTLPKLALQYTSDLAMVAEHAGKNKGKRLAVLLVDMAKHKCIHSDQISKSSIPLAWSKNKSYLINRL
jgi:hypothetical protein